MYACGIIRDVIENKNDNFCFLSTTLLAFNVFLYFPVKICTRTSYLHAASSLKVRLISERSSAVSLDGQRQLAESGARP